MRILIFFIGLGLVFLGLYHHAGGLIVAGVFTITMIAQLRS